MPGRPALGMALIEPLAQEAVIDPAEGTANGTSAIGSGAVGVGTSAFSFLRGLKVGAEGWEKPSNLVELTWDSPRYFPATLRSVESYEDIAACGTYMGNADRSLFGLDSYVQIRACGTYRRRSQPLAPFSDGNRVAPHVVGDVADGSTACSRSASRTFPFAAHKPRESNPGSQSAIPD